MDVDVIEGSTPLLERPLEAVRRHMHPEALPVNCTCVPQVAGDDVEAVVDRERALAPCPILYKNQGVRNPFEHNLAMMDEAFGSAPPVESDTSAVNLAGFTRGRDRDELDGMIAALGLRVNAHFIPEVSPSIAVGYLAAPVQVLLPNPVWSWLYDRMVRPLDIRSIDAPAPSGSRGTRDLEGARGAVRTIERLLDLARI